MRRAVLRSPVKTFVDMPVSVIGTDSGPSPLRLDCTRTVPTFADASSSFRSPSVTVIVRVSPMPMGCGVAVMMAFSFTTPWVDMVSCGKTSW